MAISRWQSRHWAIALAVALMTLLPLLTLSCKQSAIEPDTKAPFLTPPGARLTQGGDASHIGWCASGTKIAFESQNLSAGIPLGGIIKSVDLLSRTIQTLDGTPRGIYGLFVAGDSVFCDAQIVIYSDPHGTGYGEQVYLVSGNPGVGSAKPIGRGSFVAVSPDRHLVATLANTYDTLEIVGLKDTTVRQFPLQGSGLPRLFSADSRQVFFTDGRLLNIADGTWTVGPYTLTPFAYAWSWTQNGFVTISLGRDSGLDIYMLNNLITGASTVIWRQTMNDMFMPVFVWSSDGKKVAFERLSQPYSSQYMQNLYVCDIQSATSALIVTVVVRHIGMTSFSFSPDGKQIAYAVEGDIYFSDL